MLTIKADRFPLPHHPYHKLKLRTNLEGPHWEGCQTVVNLLMGSNLKYALTANIIVFLEILQMLWHNASLSKYENRGHIFIESVVLNQRVRVTEGIIRTVLQLNDDSDVLMFTRTQIEETLQLMGYNPLNAPRAVNKNGFIKPWQFLITQMGACFSKKVINHHEASHRPFLIYPHFLMRILTSQLGFRGVLAGYLRAEMRLQQNMNLSMLRPTDQNSSVMTDLWVLLEMEHGEGVDID
ncbi:hypothetical protein Hanom_Chr17g01566321 [Helianthus anomalus]